MNFSSSEFTSGLLKSTMRFPSSYGDFCESPVRGIKSIFICLPISNCFNIFPFAHIFFSCAHILDCNWNHRSMRVNAVYSFISQTLWKWMKSFWLPTLLWPDATRIFTDSVEYGKLCNDPRAMQSFILSKSHYFVPILVQRDCSCISIWTVT